MRACFIYRFGPEISAHEIQAVLLLAALGVTGLHGEAAVRVETRAVLDPAAHCVILSGDTPAGRDLNRLFGALSLRGFGPTGFEVLRVGEANRAELVEAK